MNTIHSMLIVVATVSAFASGALAQQQQQQQTAPSETKRVTEKGQNMTTKELLDSYYIGFANKTGWESVISDYFRFIGGDMTHQTPIVGKAAYIGIIKRFSQLFTAMRVKDMMIQGDNAYVLANYDYVFPGNKSINGDVVELWKVKDGKLDELRIFFDTLTFERLTKPTP